MSHAIPQISAAAAEIVALINSRPTSPSHAEIAAIISKVAGGAPSMRFQGHQDLDEWCRVLDDWLNAEDLEELSEAELGKIHDPVAAKTKAIFARPVRTWADIVMLAILVGYWNGGIDAAGPPYPDDVIADDPDGNFDARSNAYLLRGIMDLAGIEFTVDGHLRKRGGWGRFSTS
jgi:hypothetical protein